MAHLTGREMLDLSDAELIDHIANDPYDARQLQVMAAIQVRAALATTEAARASREAAEASRTVARWTKWMALATFAVALAALAQVVFR